MKTFLKAKWQNLIMANYEVEPSLLLPFLPKGVELDYFNGKCYVSLVAFLFKDTSIFNIPIPIWGSFEEVNLRFYVIRRDGKKLKRGVVFINETVPNKIVAFVANKLYKEHYTATKTKHQWTIDISNKELEYYWKGNKNWYNIKVNASSTAQKMTNGSIEHFIFEHYFGFTKVDDTRSIEYKINHPSWKINTINNYSVDVDFGAFYGKNFEFLNNTPIHSIMLAEGSDISVDWKRISF